jgi:hypothetical protein
MPDLALEGAVCPPGPTPTQPTPALNTGCLGRDPSLEHRVYSPSSVRAQRQKPFARLMGRGGPRAGAPSPEQGCQARSRCRSRLGRDRHRPRGPSHVRRFMRAERLEGSRNSRCRRVNVLSRQVTRDAAATRPRRAPPSVRVHGAPRFLSPGNSPTARAPRLAARCLAMPVRRASMRYQ